MQAQDVISGRPIKRLPWQQEAEMTAIFGLSRLRFAERYGGAEPA
jgi:hypothetical protein